MSAASIGTFVLAESAIARPDRVSTAPSRRSLRRRTYDARRALVNSPNSALFKSDTAQNDIPFWIQ